MKRLLITTTVLSGLSLAIALSGCSNSPSAYNTASNLPGPILVSPSGVRYKLVQIEGRTFIATQGAYSAYSFAGPIDIPKGEPK